MSRGLLTEGEREFLRGEKDVADPDGYERNIRYRFKQRMESLEDDLELLREHGQADLVERFYDRFGRVERLEREVEDLRQQLEQERADDASEGNP